MLFIDPLEHLGGVPNDPEQDSCCSKNLSLTLINDFVATASSPGWNALLVSPGAGETNYTLQLHNPCCHRGSLTINFEPQLRFQNPLSALREQV